MRIESRRELQSSTCNFLRRRQRALLEALERRQLLSAGDPDTAFGTNGATLVNYQGPLVSVPEAVTTDSQGRTIAAGLAAESGSPNEIAVTRYTTSGVLDSSFGVAGKVAVSVGYSGYAQAVTTDSQNRVIIAGYEQPQYNPSLAPYQFVVIRLNAVGALDTSFNGTGIETLSFAGLAAEANAVTIQADGKIVVAGEAKPSVNGSNSVAIARLNSDGSLDTSFGSSGTGEIITPVGTSSSDAYGIALDSSQRILVTGQAVVGHTSTLVMCYNTDGSLDSGFGSGGVVTVAVTNSQSFGNSIDFTPSGQIVVGGEGETYNSSTFTYPDAEDIAVLRLNSDGSLDSSFGIGGSETIDFNATNQYARAVRVLPNGDEMVAGYQIVTGNDVSMVVALTPSGAIDRSYNQTGLANTIAGEFQTSIAPDGTVALAGTLGNNGASFSAGRITSIGAVDSTFGTGGITTTNFTGTLPSNDRAIALQSDGKTIIAGSATEYPASVAAISRLNADGSLDTSFGTAGTVIDTGAQEVDAIAIQPDGKILLAGTANDSSGTTANYDMAVIRLNADGSLDSTFGTNGEVKIDNVPQYQFNQISQDFGSAIALTPDGHIIVGGFSSTSTYGPNAIALVRLTSSGVLDGTFGTGGRSSPSFLSEYPTIKSLTIDSNGEIVVTGYAQNNALQSQMFVARFTSGGATDTSFAANGIWVSNFSGGAAAQSVAIQPNGSIDIGGEVTISGYSDFTVARFTSNGVLDPSFNSSGYVIDTAIQSSSGSIVPTADGGILASGGIGKIVLAKFTASGLFDPAFGTAGVASSNLSLFSISNNPSPPVIAIEPNGYIMAAATGESVLGSGFVAMAAEFEGYSNPALGLLSGTVFQDFNGSGSVSTPVVGVPGVTVYLDLNNDQTLDSNDPRAVTTSTGQFSFTGLVPGTYTVREVYPSYYYATTPPFFTAAVSPSQPTPATVFGLAQYSTLSGVVYNDQTGSGFETGNRGLSNATVYLDLNQDGFFDSGDLSTVTDSNGNYTLSNCPAGTFTLREVVPAGVIVTQPQYAGSPGYYTVTLGPLIPTAKPFGDFTLGTATGVVFSDLNGNGVQDGAEPGLAGVTVFADVNGTGVLASNDPTAITDSTGHYQITGLTPGTVSLCTVTPAGYLPAVNSSAARIYSGTNVSYSFAEHAINSGSSISGRIFGDSNGNGVQDTGEGPLVATVFLDVNHNGGFYSNDPSAVSSSVDGSFTFINLTPGTYTVTLLLPTGWQAESAKGYFTNVTVTTGNSSSGLVFAVKPIVTTNLLTGTVIGTSGSYANSGNVAANAFDNNVSSFFDGPTASGDWVGLDLGSAKVITSLAYTSRSGWPTRMNGGVFQASNSATFTSGDATLYTIGSTANPSSGVLTTQTVRNTSAFRYVRYVAPSNSYGDVAEIQFFGKTITITTDSISGTLTGAPTGTTVYLDANNNSKFDSGELSTTISSNGSYSFSNVPTGSYVIRQVLPTGYTQTTPASNGGYSIAVTSGSKFTGKNFTDKLTLTKFTGTTIGTSGSYHNDGNTIAKATDGNLTTFFDGPTSSGDWVGLDLGSAKIVRQIQFAPRSGWASRMVGGIFQASNSANFSSGVVNLYTITSAPTQNVLTTVSVSVSTAYRYIRYLSPNGSYGDVAEIAFYG